MPTPSPYVTPAALAGRVLLRLAVVSEGQEPTADDSRIVGDEYAALHAEMTARGEIEWPHEAVPQQAVSGIRDILSARCGPMFGKWDEGTAAALEKVARSKFFRVNGRSHSAAPAPGEYF